MKNSSTKIFKAQNLAKKNLLSQWLFERINNFKILKHPPLYIDSVKIFKKKLLLNSPFQTSFGVFDSMIKYFVLINFKDKNGKIYSGIGEATPLPYPWYDGESDELTGLALKKYLIPALENFKKGICSILDFLNIYKGIVRNFMAKAAVEGAYWDAVGKLLKKPVYQLWSGKKNKIEVGTSVGGLDIKDTLERVDKAVAMKVKRVKIKIKPGFDLELVSAIRKKYPKLPLQVDANAAYLPFDSEHIKIFKKMDDFNLLMIEQPFWNDDRYYHWRFSHLIKTPICLDESIENVRHVVEAIDLWAKEGILDRLIINIKPPRVGGFWEAVKIAKVCRLVGVKTWCGGMLESAIGKRANFHFSTLTDLPGDHVSQGKPYYKKDVGNNQDLDYNNGIISISSAPGWGVKSLSY
jgi:O-succinylbenzoate synthase